MIYNQQIGEKNMKKIILSLVIVAFVCVVLSSCKTHERCPAYSKANSEKIVKNV